MATQTHSIHVVTVFNDSENARKIINSLVTDLKSEYHLVHIANAQAISAVKPVLSSLIQAPQLLITAGHWFDDEQEEIREIAKRLVPDIKLVLIPSDLKTTDEAVLEYVKEQVTESRLPRI